MNSIIDKTPSKLTVGNVSDLIHLLNKIKDKKGDLLVYANYHEFGDKVVILQASEPSLSNQHIDEYAIVTINLYHKGETVIEPNSS